MQIGTLGVGALSKAAAYAIVLSGLVNLVLTVFGRMFQAPPETFGPYMYSSVVGLTVVGVVAAAIVYALMRKFIPDAAKANKYYIVLSAVVLVASFYPDVAMPWSTDADQVGWTYGIMANLMLMHVVAAGFVWYFMPRKFV